MRYGAVDYIIKPFRFERLRAALDAYRSLKFKLAGSGSLTQEQLDQMLRLRQGAPTHELPKGLNEATLVQVKGLLQSSPVPPTAAEAADQLGLSRATARRYLDYLVKVGQARVELQYGSVGRPLCRYRPR
jgi:two-component system response regulator DctR